jgi:hypothetical protein
MKMNSTKTNILDFAATHSRVNASLLNAAYGLTTVTARQYLSALYKSNDLVRIGHGEYALPKKQIFNYTPSPEVRNMVEGLQKELPFADFCGYDGSIFTPLQHHLSINKAIYIETNRDTVESVFFKLRDQNHKVFRQPDRSVMSNYVDLREPCVIVKTLVTEAPLTSVGGIKVPALEKLLVDILKDDDLDYLSGSEASYIYSMVFELFTINVPKLLRYARRRGISETVDNLIHQDYNND